MILNEKGNIVEEEILNSIKIRENWIFHNWKVMPNHVHLLIEINKPFIQKWNYSIKTILQEDIDIELENLVLFNKNFETQSKETHSNASQQSVKKKSKEMHSNESQQNKLTDENENSTKKLSRRPRSISSFVGGIKGTVTSKINELNNLFEGSIWQSNFHDHIVRSYEEFKTVYYYIENNPKNWEDDTFNPINSKK
ncbi:MULTISPECIES: transposase [unclassified Flavobacterium]|jgi:REP element-mobilizing transposase RayT|uniref:transposase n=1 Tax=unclassified Flavobacterium TaxID=196869 RepID=UPI0025B9904E|nr:MULTISPECIES: transposase [unclassified Flavobacterium]